MSFLKHHWKKIMGSLIAICLIAILFLPFFLTSSGLLSKLINDNSGLNGKITYDSASIGWFSPVSFENFSISDQEGNEAATFQTVTLSHSLTNLILSGTNNLEVNLDGADIKIKQQGKALNWSSILESSEPSEQSEPIDLVVNLKQGRLEFSAEDKIAGELNDVNGTIGLSKGDNKSQVVDLQLASLVNAEQAKGSLEITTNLATAQNGNLETVESLFKAKNAPLDFLNPILNLLEAPEVTALVDGSSEVSFVNHSERPKLKIDCKQLKLVSNGNPTSSILNDVPLIPFRVNGEFHLNNDSPTDISLYSESIEATLKANLTDTSMASLEEIATLPVQVNGKFDLAKFAAAHPDWVELKDGIELEQATFEFTCFNRKEGNKQRMLVDLLSWPLVAKSGNRKLSWEDPIRVSCAVGRKVDSDFESLDLEFIECKSDFLKIMGSGAIGASGSEGQVNLEGDLKILDQRLRQFFDLGEIQFAGLLNGKLNWGLNTKDKAESLEFQGSSRIRDFVFSVSPDNSLKEKTIDFEFNADCSLKEMVPDALTNLVTSLVIDRDERASIQLRNPMPFDKELKPVLDVQFSGPCEKMSARISSLTGSELNLRGKSDFNAVVSITPATVRVRTRKCSIEQFALDLGESYYSEPVVRATIDMVYRPDSGKLNASQFEAGNRSLNISSRNLEIDTRAELPVASGRFNIKGIVGKLATALTPKTTFVHGDVNGWIDFSTAKGVTTWETSLESKRFEVRERIPNSGNPKTKFKKLIPSGPVSIVGKGKLDNGLIQLDELVVEAIKSKVAVTGVVQSEANPVRVDMQAKVNTELQQLIDFYAPSLAEGIKLSGNQATSISVSGPIANREDEPSISLVPEELKATTKINWDKGEIFALPLESGELFIDLERSEIVLRPQKLRIASGSFLASPRFDLRQPPYNMTVPAGPIVQDTEIRPEVFRSWMRYLTPLFADAAEAKGKFSFVLDQDAEMPMEQPLSGRLRGRLAIDGIQVGPGPTGQSVISLVQQILSIAGKGSLLKSLSDKPWLEMPKQDIKVSIDGGKVSHEQLQFRIGEVDVYTQGWVDADQNIDMVLVIPMEKAWFKDRPFLDTVFGEGLRIPIKGHLTKPELDAQFIGGMSQKLATATAQKLLDPKTQELLKGTLFDSELLKGDLLKGDLLKGGLLDGKILNGDLLKGELMKGGLFKGGFLKGNLLKGKKEDESEEEPRKDRPFGGRARDLLKKGLLKGLEKLNKDDK